MSIRPISQRLTARQRNTRPNLDFLSIRRDERRQSSKADDSASGMEFHPGRWRRHKLRQAKTALLAIAMLQIAVRLKKA
jgi:hypothetical protein